MVSRLYQRKQLQHDILEVCWQDPWVLMATENVCNLNLTDAISHGEMPFQYLWIIQRDEGGSKRMAHKSFKKGGPTIRH